MKISRHIFAVCLVVIVALAVYTVSARITEATSYTVSTFASGFSDPTDLAFDSSGNLYVSNASTGAPGLSVTKITPAGATSTFATGFTNPTSLLFDSSGNLYVGDGNPYGSGGIFKITPSGTKTKPFTSSNAGIYALAMDPSGNLYGAGLGGSPGVFKLTKTGTVSTVLSGIGSVQIIRSDSAGNVYSGSNIAHLYKISSSGAVTTFSSVSVPVGSIAIDSSNDAYFLGDSSSLKKVTPSGVISNVTAISDGGDMIVGPDGNIYMLGYFTGKVFQITPAGASTTIASGLVHPSSLAFGPDGSLYVADIGNNAIWKITFSNCPTALGLVSGNSSAFDLIAGIVSRLVSAVGLSFCVSNSGNKHIFIPAKTSAELQSFYNSAAARKIPNVSVQNP